MNEDDDDNNDTDYDSTTDNQQERNAAWEQYATNEKRRKAQLGLHTSAVFFTPSSSPAKTSSSSPSPGRSSSDLNGLGMARHAASPSIASKASSGYTSGDGSTQEVESWSSHGSSSKQLINDLVLLEK